jgi:hypothetical protein
MEIVLATVESGEVVAGAVKLQEFELVGGGGEIAPRGPIVVGALLLALLVQWPHNALGALRLSRPSGRRVQFLLPGGLLLDRGLERGHLVLKGLQGLHLHIYGAQMM